MVNVELTLPDFRRTLAAWQIIVSTIGTDSLCDLMPKIYLVNRN
jgi:hypothetical protein